MNQGRDTTGSGYLFNAAVSAHRDAVIAALAPLFLGMKGMGPMALRPHHWRAVFLIVNLFLRRVTGRQAASLFPRPEPNSPNPMAGRCSSVGFLTMKQLSTGLPVYDWACSR